MRSFLLHFRIGQMPMIATWITSDARVCHLAHSDLRWTLGQNFMLHKFLVKYCTHTVCISLQHFQLAQTDSRLSTFTKAESKCCSFYFDLLSSRSVAVNFSQTLRLDRFGEPLNHWQNSMKVKFLNRVSSSLIFRISRVNIACCSFFYILHNARSNVQTFNDSVSLLIRSSILH